MLKRILSSGFAAVCLASTVALAHEGHGEATWQGGNSATHYVTQPLHVAQIALIIAVLLSAAVWICKHYFSRTSQP